MNFLIELFSFWSNLKYLENRDMEIDESVLMSRHANQKMYIESTIKIIHGGLLNYVFFLVCTNIKKITLEFTLGVPVLLLQPQIFLSFFTASA